MLDTPRIDTFMSSEGGDVKLPSKPKFLSLELTRFICALIVCLDHVVTKTELGFVDWTHPQPHVRLLIFAGRGSVAVFFILSGFVISYSSRGERNLGRYVAKRFVRIYPLFILAGAIGILMVSKGLSPGGFTVVRESPGLILQVIAHALMIQQAQFIPSVDWLQPIIGPMWSLSFEFWFYLAFGLVVIWQGKRVRAPMVLGVAMLSSVAMFARPWAGWLYPVYFAVWWAGVEVAEELRETSRISFRRVAPYAAGLLVVLLECVILQKVTHSTAYIPLNQFLGIHFATAIGVLLVVSLRQGAFLHWKPAKPHLISKLGAASYAIYLFHEPIRDLVLYVAQMIGIPVAKDHWLLVPPILALTILISLLLEHSVHAPIARYLSRYLAASAPQSENNAAGLVPGLSDRGGKPTA